MEQIVFPVPNICEFLTQESKLRVYYTTERDEQGSKINDFFLRSEDLFNEMNWQKKLRGDHFQPPSWTLHAAVRGAILEAKLHFVASKFGSVCEMIHFAFACCTVICVPLL